MEEATNQWETIEWQAAEDHVRQMQEQLVKHYRKGNWRKVIACQRMIANSFHAKCLAVRRVTSNRGKHTAGIDGEKWKTSVAKMTAVYQLTKRGYKPSPLKRVLIDKGRGDGSTRPLGIPTMHDRAMQALYLLTLDPIAEANADHRSYGFRQYRSAHDAVKNLRAIYNKNAAVWVIDADIKGFFDNISHDWIVENIPMDKTILKKFLNAGFIYKQKQYPTERGVPQGGIISPTIANMVLDGLEKTLQERYWRRTPKGEVSQRNNQWNVSFVRYADDFVISCKEKAKCEEILAVVNEFLIERGVELSTTKTHIRHIDEGFDFLGFTLRRFYRQGKYKLIIKPAKEKVKQFLGKVRQIIRKHNGASQTRLIQKLNPIIRGWGNYYQFCNAKRTFGNCDHRIWEALWAWAKRRHKRKGKAWLKQRYWHHWGSRDWTFMVKEGKQSLAKLVYLGDYRIKRWSMLKIHYNAFEHRQEIEDGLIRRGARLMNGKFKQVYATQDGQCPLCQQAIFNPTQKYEIHHNWPRKWGGTNRSNNLWYIHERCHISYHAQNKVVNPNSKNARYYINRYKPLRLVDPRKEYSDRVRTLLSGVAM